MSAVSVSRAAATPLSLSHRIRVDIEGRILSGEWLPGHRLPFEHELMAQYDCARMTVNKAMSALAEAGLIERRRRAGSFVARPRVQSAILDIADIRADIEARGKVYGYQLLGRAERAAAVGSAEEVELAGGGTLLSLRCLHLADACPFSLEERLISLAAVPDARDADFDQQAPGAWLLGHVPWTEAEHRISALGADGMVAAALGLAPGAPCLMVERRTWRGQEHITRVAQTFPGGSYDLVARFVPKAG